ncbi:histidinol-phosphate aminotransferase family protein [Staphylococcus massiliensis]|uniref:pyridoxal phosphate-dependent aminotransferase n=1 Tax=Staphylococcus massiliensis TaxID=555791 RepID=UPI001EDD627F|nr:histidinol-phosphate transaminase [Staphylococcus massiliensis]MCG3401265.1 histidinol-phosphate aminotransferase family protein [Staphylococcus massiliensis]
MIRIHKNESPIPPLSSEVVGDIISNISVQQYPGREYDEFKAAYANFYNIKVSQIICGNGSDELIQKLMILMPEGPILTLNPDFFMYRAYAKQLQRDIHFVEADDRLVFSKERILNAIKTLRPSCFILSSPHNPTGYHFKDGFLLDLAVEMKAIGGYLVVDEAYMDYGEPANLPFQDHIIQLRTLSKAYSLAGLRIGVAISTDATIDVLKRIEHPYPLNTFALKIATYMFEHVDATTRYIEHQRALADRLKSIFSKVAHLMTVYPSATNFVLTKGERARALGAFIHQNGFLPRFYEETGMTDCVRYSITTQKHLNQLEQLVETWRDTHDI